MVVVVFTHFSPSAAGRIINNKRILGKIADLSKSSFSKTPKHGNLIQRTLIKGVIKTRR